MGDLPVQHGQLVAEHEDLRVLGRGIHPMDANDLNDVPDETAEEGQGHDRQASPSVWLDKVGQGDSGPFRLFPTDVPGDDNRSMQKRLKRAGPRSP
jgi:hypothetical protein